MSLPPGQRYREDFPRFGLDQFAERVVEAPEAWSVAVLGDLDQPFALDHDALATLPRVEQTSDFHCVTTWSAKGLRWAGWRFRDVYERLIEDRISSRADVKYVKLTALDGYRCVLRLDDALIDDVLLADTLDGQPLDRVHGAPLRLVAPRQYGFKSLKHLKRIELSEAPPTNRPLTPLPFMDHLRARVALEERGQCPAWLLRQLYRPLIGRTVRKFRRALS